MKLVIIPSMPNFLTYLTIHKRFGEHEIFIDKSICPDLNYFNLEAKHASQTALMLKRYKKIIYTDTVFLGGFFDLYLYRKYIYRSRIVFNLLQEITKKIIKSKCRKLTFKHVKSKPYLCLFKEFVTFEYKGIHYPGIKSANTGITNVLDYKILKKSKLINYTKIKKILKEKYNIDKSSHTYILIDNKYNMESINRLVSTAIQCEKNGGKIFIKRHPTNSFNDISKMNLFPELKLNLPLELIYFSLNSNVTLIGEDSQALFVK
jgi:hypothetical protein